MSLGHFFGGVAQGIGAGLVRQGEMNQRSQEAEAGRRHDIALQELRHQQSTQQQEQQFNLADRNAERNDARGDMYNARQVARQTNASVTVDNNRAGNDRQRDAQRHSYDVQMQQIKFANDQDMARLQNRLTQSSAAYAQALRANEVAEVLAGGDGKLYFRTHGGELRPTGVDATPRELNGGSGGGSSILSAARGGGAATGAPAPTPAPMPAQGRQVPTQNRQAPAPAVPAQSGGRMPGLAGAPRLSSNQEAEAFVRNPANRGRMFIGPDGNVYTAN